MAYFDLSSKNLTRYWAVSYVAVLIFDTVNLSGSSFALIVLGIITLVSQAED